MTSRLGTRACYRILQPSFRSRKRHSIPEADRSDVLTRYIHVYTETLRNEPAKACRLFGNGDNRGRCVHARNRIITMRTTNRKKVMITRRIPAVFALIFVLYGCQPPDPSDTAPINYTEFEVDATWPKSLPNNWILGQVAGIDVDANDNIWIVHRPLSLTAEETGALQDPPLSGCCVPAPSVIQFDQEGNVLQAWGGPDSEEQWPETEHGLFIDKDGNIWIASAGPNDHVVLKFRPDGERLLRIGEWGQTGGSNNTDLLGAATDIAVDAEANEVYISDGYGNRRIIVYNATTGAYKRHWGAYGETPSDDPLPDFVPGEEPARSFRSPMHAVRIATDGMVYAADRVNNRIQVFAKDGTYVKEGFVAPNTRSMGSVWDLELSIDPDQTYLYIPDGSNMKVWIVKRDDFEVVGSFGNGGRQAGQFNWVHNIAADSRGNLYTTEVNTGKRVQRFVPKIG